MKKAINTERIEGRIYQHSLSVKTVQNQTSTNYGKEFISGNLEIAVDEEGLNVIPVHFTYVTETTSQGNKNATFTNLKRIIDGLGVTGANPVFTKVWGKINCSTIVTEVKEDSAFGESSVRTFERKVREWVITGTARVPYDFGDEKVLTADELTKAMQNREVMLAETKKRSEEYRASKSATSAPATNFGPAATTAKTGTFNF